MGDKSAAYIEKASDYFNTHPDYITRRMSAKDLAADLELRKALAPLRALTLTVCQMIDDTMMAAGSDLMDAGSANYRSVQDAAKDGDAAARTVYEALRQRYPAVSRRAAAKGTDEAA